MGYALALGFVASLILLFSTSSSFTTRSAFTPIESLGVLPIWPFSAAYIFFFSTGLLVALRTRSQVIRLLLVGAFASLVLGFWPIKSPLGMYESVPKLTNMNIILQTGHFEASQGNYLDWPSLFILGSFFSEVAGFPSSVFLPAFLLVYSWIIGISFYAFSAKVIGPGFVSFLAASMAMGGNLIFATYSFHPEILGVVLVVLAVMMYLKPEAKRTGVFVITAILGAALIAESFTGATVLFFFLLLLPLRNKIRNGTFAPVRPFLLFTIMFTTWSLYWAVVASTNVISLILPSLSNPLAGIFHVSALYQANIQEPLWAIWTHYFWLAFGVLIPLVIALVAVWRGPKTYTVPTLFMLASFLTAGVALLNNGTNYFAILLYGPVAGSILVLLLIRKRRFLLILFVLSLVAFSVPTFFVLGNRVDSGYVSAQEYTSAEFLAAFDHTAVVYNPSSYVTYLNSVVPTAGQPQLFTGAPGSGYATSQAEAVLLAYYNKYTLSGGVLQFAVANLENVYHLYGPVISSSIDSALLSSCRSEGIVYSNHQYIVCESNA